MKTFTSVLSALIVAPILLIGGCTVLSLIAGMVQTESTIRHCMAQSPRTYTQCENALLRANEQSERSHEPTKQGDKP